MLTQRYFYVDYSFKNMSREEFRTSCVSAMLKTTGSTEIYVCA
jgi:hypothetical protein